MNTLSNRYVVGLMIGMMALGLSGGLAWAGSLEPPASAVDGSGNPVPTTIDALDALQTDVDTIILQPIDDGDIRFVSLFDERVLDNRTGLEWERSPSTSLRNHADSIAYCDGLSVGVHSDWRLPERDELASLVDLDNPGGNPDLPPGHQFVNVQSSFYWSATFFASNPGLAWLVGFTNGFGTTSPVGNTRFAWCVR